MYAKAIQMGTEVVAVAVFSVNGKRAHIHQVMVNESFQRKAMASLLVGTDMTIIISYCTTRIQLHIFFFIIFAECIVCEHDAHTWTYETTNVYFKRLVVSFLRRHHDFHTVFNGIALKIIMSSKKQQSGRSDSGYTSDRTINVVARELQAKLQMVPVAKRPAPAQFVTNGPKNFIAVADSAVALNTTFSFIYW